MLRASINKKKHPEVQNTSKCFFFILLLKLLPNLNLPATMGLFGINIGLYGSKEDATTTPRFDEDPKNLWYIGVYTFEPTPKKLDWWTKKWTKENSVILKKLWPWVKKEILQNHSCASFFPFYQKTLFVFCVFFHPQQATYFASLCSIAPLPRWSLLSADHQSHRAGLFTRISAHRASLGRPEASSFFLVESFAGWFEGGLFGFTSRFCLVLLECAVS